jgi:hypothetical protein
MKCVIKGISAIAPGLEDWEQASAVLRGVQPWSHEPLGKLTPALLPPNERRRTTQLIKLALQTAEAAQQQSGIDAAALACVFASSDGDTFIVDKLCDALSLPDRPVSPTQFHNSVHNAAAGYWAIASGAKRFSTSISAGAASFAAGLIEAMSYVAGEDEPVLLVAYDVALPDALDAFGINHEPFAVALVLAPEGESGMASLSLTDSAAATELPEDIDALRRANPAGESLPLLQALATGQETNVAVAYLDGTSLNLAVTPC